MGGPNDDAPAGTAGQNGRADAGSASSAPAVEDRQLLAQQARKHGVRDPAVLAAVGQVPREMFVPEECVESAFADRPLPIGEGQTISQPAMVALMAEAARIAADDNVLEVGSGSGYGAAVLRTLAGRVTTIERIKTLAERARNALERCGFSDVEVVIGDGTLGWPEQAPYDAIVVTAAGPSAPPPLIEQLGDRGRLIMPVGAKNRSQHLMRFTRQPSGDSRESAARRRLHKPAGKHRSRRRERRRAELRVREERLMPVRFVPLLGMHGF